MAVDYTKKLISQVKVQDNQVTLLHKTPRNPDSFWVLSIWGFLVHRFVLLLWLRMEHALVCLWSKQQEGGRW